MNTGMQDAANLSWKLAAAVKGWAPQGLLDTYHTERYPVGRLVLRSSGTIIRLAMIRSWFGRTVRNLVGTVVLRRRHIAAKAAGTVSAIGVRYTAPRGAHRSVGTRVPDIALTNGRLFEALRSGRFVLVTDEPPGTEFPQVDVVTPAEHRGEAVLVRPDGYVAWAGEPAGFPAWGRTYFG